MLLAAIFACFSALAGEPVYATTSDGRIVTLNADGTWAYTEGEQVRMLEADRERIAQLLLNEMTDAVTNGDLDTAKAKLKQLEAGYSMTTAHRRAARFAAELEVVGKEVPDTLDVQMWFANEARIDLHGDSPVLLVFWETWCPHCRREVPKLQQLWERYQPRGVQVVGLTRVNRASTDEKVHSFIQEHGITFPMGKERQQDGKGNLSSFYAVRGIPALAVVKRGKVIWRGHPGRVSDALMERWLE